MAEGRGRGGRTARPPIDICPLANLRENIPGLGSREADQLAALTRSEPEADLFEAAAAILGYLAVLGPSTQITHSCPKRRIFAPLERNVAVAMLLPEPDKLGEPLLPECGDWIPLEPKRCEPLHLAGRKLAAL